MDRTGSISLDGETLTLDEVVIIARLGVGVTASEEAMERVKKCSELVNRFVASGERIYGITTGVGELSNTVIPAEQLRDLQKNLILSHAGGVGELFPDEIVRAMMVLRANSLLKGYSGVRPKVISTLLDMLNSSIHPEVPSQGSVGSSGDLVPLAHIALALMGKGYVNYKGERMEAGAALTDAGIEPIILGPKEGLGLINGTQAMTALACMAVHDADVLIRTAQIAASMSLEALMGTWRAYDKRIQQVRPHVGQTRIAQNMRRLLKGSEIYESHVDCDKVQDPYSLRCVPQVLGASLDALEYVKGVVQVEVNSATDNPLIFVEESEFLSGGNFHGQPLALALDFLTIAVSEVGSIAERRLDRLTNPHVSNLKPFLSEDSGVNSGYMIAQYVAAALASENKSLCHPASVDSIPTSAGKEDHNSMGTIAGRKCRQVLVNVETIVAIELLCAAQALDFHKHRPGDGAARAHKTVREAIPHLSSDRLLQDDIERAKKLVHDGTVLGAVQDVVTLV